MRTKLEVAARHLLKLKLPDFCFFLPLYTFCPRVVFSSGAILAAFTSRETHCHDEIFQHPEICRAIRGIAAGRLHP
jgi:hypothetical protein